MPLSDFVPRGFGIVHHSIATLYHQVPNANTVSRIAYFASLYVVEAGGLTHQGVVFLAAILTFFEAGAALYGF